ncbi:secondary thiamine-phosphate synthase enzyme (macronuclear) [Tetrahymena thermophila SB210]|uniref:Secondary thiamine-phosphate synthase enzyme n=1 Tax=Tetrahymena thermophila (strain SB210) TaxID=312017 RepID=W7X0K6_TETTS|nr:secondary thiamine-phosphate synthase enzyme [Tetrahymena thermophila SB210]EWS72670.1 secondary thiamine-phosphate synthase enzyme [Tetrahymena thermophila SB210]|eukprot:XP_012654795.1 secondary thiamine-phosphate synthase enzyme [Tetrahymena thermophila SB210]
MQQSHWFQREIQLKQKGRGCHLITDEIKNQIKEIQNFKIGNATLFLKHTSASISLNENFDPDVRLDMEDTLNRIVPEGNKLYRHSSEGKDDMPAHVKSQLIGVSLTIPITDGDFNLGTWQGIYLNEHRDGKHSRTLVVTINGQPK